MTRRGWVAVLAMVAVVIAPRSSRAQELRRDTISNGVLIGAGTGAAAGVVMGLTSDEICSPGACAYLGAVSGGLIGLLVDRDLGEPRAVAPGSTIDDGLVNGAIIGALSGAAVSLLEARHRCRPESGQPPCTRKGVALDIIRAAEWMALVGFLIDAAVPSKAQRPRGAASDGSQRQLAVGFSVRF